MGLGLWSWGVLAAGACAAEGTGVLELSLADEDWLRYQRRSSHRHVATLRALRPGRGNIVALLDGIDRPAHVEIVTSDSAGAAQVEVRVARSASRAAQTALAADRQGRYLDAHLALMAHEGEYDEESIKRIGADLGLDVEQMLEDMQSAEVAALIEANQALARKLGVDGTPAFLVAGPAAVRVAPSALDADRPSDLIDAAGGE